MGDASLPPKRKPYIPPSFSSLPQILASHGSRGLPCTVAAAQMERKDYERSGVGAAGWVEYLRRSVAMGFVRVWNEGEDRVALVEEVEVKGGRSEPVSPREETGKDPRKRRCSTPSREMKLAKGCSSPRMREGTPPQPQAQELVPIPFLLADSPPIPIPPRLLSPPRNTATTLNLGEPLPASISSRLMSLLLYPMPFSTTAASLALAFPPNLLFDTFLGFDPVSASSSQSATVILGWLAQEESTATEVKLFLAAHEHFRDVAVREFQGGAEWEWGDVYDEGTREEWSKATVRSPTPDVVDLVKHADPTPPSSPLSISSTSPRTPSRPFRSPSLILMPPTSPPPPPMKSTPPTAPALISTQGRTTTAGGGRGNQYSPGRVPNRPNLHSCPPAFKLSKAAFVPLVNVFHGFAPGYTVESTVLYRVLLTRYGLGFLSGRNWNQYLEAAKEIGIASILPSGIQLVHSNQEREEGEVDPPRPLPHSLTRRFTNYVFTNLPLSTLTTASEDNPSGSFIRRCKGAYAISFVSHPTSITATIGFWDPSSSDHISIAAKMHALADSMGRDVTFVLLGPKVPWNWAEVKEEKRKVLGHVYWAEQYS